jgi:hypothetical protein
MTFTHLGCPEILNGTSTLSGGCRQADRRKMAASQTLTDSCGQIVVAVPLCRMGIPGRGLERRLVVVVTCPGGLARRRRSARRPSIVLCRDRHSGLLV